MKNCIDDKQSEFSRFVEEIVENKVLVASLLAIWLDYFEIPLDIENFAEDIKQLAGYAQLCTDKDELNREIVRSFEEGWQGRTKAQLDYYHFLRCASEANMPN